MDKITIVDNEFATAWCYPTKRLIHHQFHKFCTGEDFRAVMLQNADAFEKYKCTKWLSDDRNIGLVQREDVAWGREHWAPRVIRAGWRFFAMLLPTKAIGRITNTSIVDEFKEMGIEARIFTSSEEGMAWLDSKGIIYKPG